MPSKSNQNSRNRASASSNAAWSTNSQDVRETYSSADWGSITSLSATDTITTITNKKIVNLQANLPEDMRISKLLRQLGAEKDPEQVVQVCKKLRVAIEDPANTSYIRRSFDILADSMMKIFKDGPIVSMAEVATIFGLMGWVVRSDFSIYRIWLTRMYKVERIRVWVMHSLEFTLTKDEHQREIRSDVCNRLIEQLKDYLENTDKSDHFIAITRAIGQFALNYPKQFTSHFADIVDIVIGWHLEVDQTRSIKKHCSQILQSFQPFWINDVSFTRNLLGQFLEDMTSYRDEVQQNLAQCNAERLASPPEICFGSIVGCTNSILKCIYDSSASLSQHVGLSLLNDLFQCVIDVTQITLECEGKQLVSTVLQNDAIYMGANELTIIILDCTKYGIDIPEKKLINVVSLQIRHLNIENDSRHKILAILFVIYKMICELKAKVPISLVQEVFSSTESNSSCIVHRLLFSNDKHIKKAIIRIYHAVLNLKNVEILQEAYKLVMKDLDVAMKTICCDNEPLIYTQREAEYVICIHLSVLSTLAISNSSLIVLWALQPSILEMLTTHLKCSHYDDVWYKGPETHFAILKLIESHCRSNNNFVASSLLLKSNINDVFNKLNLDDTNGRKVSTGMVFGAGASSTDSSPTSAHFELILKFLSNLLAQKMLTDHHLLHLLDWCYTIITQAAQYADILKHNSDFKRILELIVQLSASNPSTKIIEKSGDCLLMLLQIDELDMDVFQSIAENCCIHMCSIDSNVRSQYSQILGKLPLNIALRQVNQFTGLAKTHARSVSTVQHWHSRKPIQHGGGEMRPHFFSDFIRCIKIHSNLNGKSDDHGLEPFDEFVENVLQNMFIHSWTHSNEFDESEELKSIQLAYDNSATYRQVAVNDIRSVIAWAQWEAAQFCVNNKLRTVLGKPQETFLKIESIIKEDARTLSLNDTTKATNIETILWNQRHTRILLGFMEALEKSIYNASEGTAVALTQADKPARTFFHINSPTCNEWFNRIRTAVDWVALHCMEPEMVIRYTEAVMKGLLLNGKMNDPIFEHTLMSNAWALLRNGESNALHGLFTWAKTKTNKKVGWIKLIAGNLYLMKYRKYDRQI